MIHNRSFRVVAGTIAVLALAASCSSSGGSSGGAVKPGGPIPSSPGYDADTKTITLGVLTPTTSLAKLISDPLTAGNKLFFEELNAKGGINGKYKVKLLVEDNKYGTADYAGTEVAYQKTKDKVAAYLQVLGSDPLHTILPNLAYDDVLAGPATLESEWYESPNLMPLTAPYQVEAANGLDYYTKHMGGEGKKVCTMTSDDGYGRAALSGAQFAAKLLGFPITDSQTFASSISGGVYDAQVATLQAKGCEAVVLASLPTDTIGIFTAAMKVGFAPQWLGSAPTWISLVAQGATAQYAADHYVVVVDGPQWGDSSVAGMRKLLAARAKFDPKASPNFYYGFGYIQSDAMTQILTKAIAQGDLSHAGIVKAMHDVGMITTGGQLPDQKYGAPGVRQPQRVTSIFRVDPTSIPVTGGLVYYNPGARNYRSEAATKVPLASGS